MLNPNSTDDSNVDITKLLDKCLVAIQREVNNLFTLAHQGKLPDKEARELRDYTKMLQELEIRQAEAAKQAAKLAVAKAAEPDHFVR